MFGRLDLRTPVMDYKFDRTDGWVLLRQVVRFHHSELLCPTTEEDG